MERHLEEKIGDRKKNEAMGQYAAQKPQTSESTFSILREVF